MSKRERHDPLTCNCLRNPDRTAHRTAASARTSGLPPALLVFGAVLVWLALAASPARATIGGDCGGHNDRACCTGIGEASNACDSGLVQISNPGKFCRDNFGDAECLCGRVFGVPIYAAGICKQISDCGGEGQRGCCIDPVGDTGKAGCDGDLLEISSPDTCRDQLSDDDCICSEALNYAVFSDGVCTAKQPCGGEGQRACCTIESRFFNVGFCESGLVQKAGCDARLTSDNSCLCSEAFGVPVYSDGKCEVPTCGDLGERACCLLERVPACDDELAESIIPTCEMVDPAGGCECGFGPGSSVGVCRKEKQIGEIGCIPRIDGDPVPGTIPCVEGLKCVPSIFGESHPTIDGSPESATMCVATPAYLAAQGAAEGDSPAATLCKALFSPVLQTVAEAAGQTLTFGLAVSASAGFSQSFEAGIAYGADGCFACYSTGCTGVLTDVEVSGAICLGEIFDGLITSVAGQSCVETIGGDIPGTEIGFAISSVFGGSPAGLSCGGSNIGTAECLSVGLGVNPVNIGAFNCSTQAPVVGCRNQVTGDVDVMNPSELSCLPVGPIACDPNGDPVALPTLVQVGDEVEIPPGLSIVYQWLAACPGAAMLDDPTAANPSLTISDPRTCLLGCSLVQAAGFGIPGEPLVSPLQFCSVEVIGSLPPPTITAEAADGSVECGGDLSGELSSWIGSQGGASASSDCSEVTWSDALMATSAADCTGLPSWTYAFVAEDTCGQAASTSATFSVEDTTAPAIDTAASNLMKECDGAGNAADLAAWLGIQGGASASDACTAVTWSDNFTALSNGCGATGSALVTFDAIDACGLATGTSATFTIADTTAPQIDTAASNQTVECDGAGNAVDLAAWLGTQGGASASDVCAAVTWSDNFTALSNGCGATGSATVRFTATDDCSQFSTTPASFTIQDMTDPTISCPSTRYQESPAGQCTQNVAYSVTAGDVCGATSISCVPNNMGATGVTPTGGNFPVGTTTVTCTATDACMRTNQCAFDVVVNDPPQIISVSPATQMVQYSDKIVPVVVTATDCGPGTTLTLEFDPADVPGGLALSSTADSCVVNTSLLNECTFTLGNNTRVLEPEGDYVIDGIKAVDPVQLNGVTLKSSPAKTITVQVKAENATIAFYGGNPVSVLVATDGGDSGAFGLSVDVQELLPELVTTGGNLPGDVGLAVVSMTLVPVGPGGPVVGTCTTDNNPPAFDYSGVLAVTCAFNGVPVNLYTAEAVLVANGASELFYIGSGDDVLVVYDPSLGFTTGGGHIAWPGTGDRTNWGYTMKYNRKLTKVKGSLLVIRHLPDGTKFRIKSNALDGLAIGDGAGFGWASFAGKCTYSDPSMVDPEGNHKFVTYVEDHGEPGAGADRFWLQVLDKHRVLIGDLSMDKPAVSNAETLVGGNIVVPHR